jgi:phage-related protein
VAYNAGSAFISIAPSFRGFNTKVAAYMKSLRPVSVPVEFKASSKPILPPRIKNPKITPEVDSRSALRQIGAIESRLDRLTRGRFLINVGIAASPLAVPAIAAGAGLGAALGVAGGAGIAGVAGFAAIATASLDRVLESQEALTKATEDRRAAVASLRAAESGLASAVQGAQRAQLDASRAIADAERALADARRNAARSVQDAERALADARAEAARRSEQAHRDVVAAQEQLVASQDAVRRSLEDLHAAREQAKRDLDELAERTRDNALTIEGAEIALIEAQQRLAELEGNGESSALDLRKARLELAVAEDRLSDARRQAQEDAAKLAAAEKAGVEGSAVVQEARAQLEEARQNRQDAATALSEARQAAQRVELENVRAIADAERNLRQTRADAARSIADAERNLARTRVDAAQSVADAQQNIADAQARVAAASAAVAAADKARREALDGLGPAQKAAARAVERLQAAWNKFLDATSRPVLGALIAGMAALTGALPALTNFIRPVARGFRDMFTMFGDAAATKSFQRFAGTIGRFAREILADAAKGTLNLVRAFGNLFIAFMPLGSDMSDGLVKLTERFANWSKTVGQSQDFKSFIAYVRETGPLLLSTLAAVGKALIAVGKALAPMAAAMLRGIAAFAEWIAKTAEAHPWLVRIIAGFALLVAGVSALARPLAAIVGVFKLLVGGVGAAIRIIKIVVFNLRVLWMVLAANPLGLVVTIIGLLVAGFILAYKKSETFRDIVDGAMRAVAKAGKWMWNTVLKPVFGFLVDAFKGAWDAAVAMKDGIGAAWDWITEKVRKATMWLVDKVLWMAEKVLGAAVAAFGWAPGIGDKLKAAHEKVKDFRKAINRELDAISDEEVKIRIAVSENQQKKSDRMMDRFGGAGPLPVAAAHARRRMHGGMGGSGILPRLSTDGSALNDITAQASERAQAIAARLEESLRKAAATSGTLGPAGKAGRVLPRGSYRIGMPYLGYPGHYGADYPAPTGTPVYTPWAGRVVASYDLPGSNPYNSTPYRSYGRVVRISHPNGLSTLYAHLSSRIGSVGRVAAGQMIGRVGMNGNATGPHLHFEVERNGAKTNPAGYGLFDAGGLARTAGLMAKGPMPERVLDARQTEAFEKALDQGFDSGDRLVRLSRADMDYLAGQTGNSFARGSATIKQKGQR